ncbi:MAG TPA: sigma-70 family RNA polymerase sigma factor [Planctomycetota bacterium]|nr:sigma-70 family RNA polymerase sigma factor [Planctomycetota bacterium]
MTPADRGEQFVRLFVQNQKRIQGLILALVPKGADADDILQEASAVMWQKFSEFELGTNFAAWALRIARYQVMAYYTAQKRQRARLSDESLDAVVETLARRAEREEDRTLALEGCLAGLDRSDRELLDLRYRSGATVGDLARQSGKTVFAVYKALNRAHDRLLGCMRGKLSTEGAERG